MKCESCVYGVNVGGKLHCASPYFPKPKIYEKVDNCKEYEPIKKPITNFDKIRAMSDEELAKWIETIASCTICQFKNKSCKGVRVESRASCKQHWLDWLGQEAT